MFEFTDKFDTIESDELILRIIDKNSGDDKILPFYYYEIIRKCDNEVVGKISIRIGNSLHSYYGGHIGYEVFAEYRGNSYAYKASLMVLAVAEFHGMKFIYLTCKENNVASYKTIEKLGARLLEICYPSKEYYGWYENIKKQRIYMLTLTQKG